MLGPPVRELALEDAEFKAGVACVQTAGGARSLRSVEHESGGRFFEERGQPVVKFGGGDVERARDVTGLVGRA